MLCSCRLNKCSISYWQSIMNFNTIKQQIEMIIMKNRWLYSLLLVSIIYLVLFYFNFTAYIGDFFEEEKYGFCMHCNGSVICGTCKCARTVLHWIVKWWRLSLLSGKGPCHRSCKYEKQGSHSTWKTWKNESIPGKPGNIMEFWKI